MKESIRQLAAEQIRKDGCTMPVAQMPWPLSEWVCGTCTTHFYMRGAPSHCPQCGVRFNTWRETEQEQAIERRTGDNG